MLANIGYAVVYTGVGILLLVVGALALDLLTPGHLARHIYEERSVNAGIALAAGFLGQGAIAFTTATISSTSVVSRQIGQASMSANRLNSAALPSITGIEAPGPMSPRPSTAEPSVTTATVLPLMVSRRTSSGCSASARQTRATPGV